MFCERFAAGDLATRINTTATEHTLVVREFLFPTLASETKVTPKGVGKRLKARVGKPAKHGKRTLMLKASMDKHAGTYAFQVAEIGSCRVWRVLRVRYVVPASPNYSYAV
jgi:hypothetical protein